MAAVEAADPAPGRDDVVVFCPDRNRYIRVQGPQWAFLRSLDGQRTIAELERDFAGRLPDSMVRPLLARFGEVGLLEGSVGNEPRLANRRLRVTKFGVVEFALLNPNRFLDRLMPVIRALGASAGRLASALIVISGLFSLAVHADWTALDSGWLRNPSWTATLIASLLLCVVLHEVGHAAAVRYFGGRVRRMGVMLLYLVPAMFCDTSDAWRFPRNRQRAVVAAAGIWVQMVIAGLAGLALWLPVRAGVTAWLSCFALLNLGFCVVNLIPFVKLDGYWMLVALTDVPNLRAHALGALRATALRVATGVAQPQAPPSRHAILTVMFGLGCALLPPVLILTALLQFQHVLLRLGRAGAAAWLLLAGGVAVATGKGLLRFVRSARELPSRARWRATIVGGAGLLTVAGMLAVARVPLTVHGRFEVSGTGEIIAVLPAGARARLGAGDHIQLRVPSGTGRPFAAGGVLAPGGQSSGQELRYRVVLDRGAARELPQPAVGPLSVRAGEVAIPTWLWNVYLQPVLAILGTSAETAEGVTEPPKAKAYQAKAHQGISPRSGAGHIAQQVLEPL